MICRASDRSLLFRKDEPAVGICEPCTLAAHWAWRQRAGEIPPGVPEEDLKKVSTVFALIVRRKEIPKLDAGPGDDEQVIRAPAELNSSWEFLLVDNGDGTFVPPAISLDQQPDLRDLPRSALLALSGAGLVSWPALAEPLFTGYSPRGRLVSVVLIRGWADLPASHAPFVRPKMAWRSWPLSAHTGPMAGFWKALESVWSLRLHKHCVVEDSGELCLQLREAACRYIELQISLRSKKTSDSSMAGIYRASLSVDELKVERLIQLAEERAGAGRSLAVIPKETGRPSSVPSLRRGSSIAPWDDPADGSGQGDPDEDEGTGDDEVSDDETDDSGDLDDSGDPEQEDSTFVRPRRPLKR
jgi:hypothetical protein